MLRFARLTAIDRWSTGRERGSRSQRGICEREPLSLPVDGIEKVMRGITTITEVFRVAKKQEGDQSLAALAEAAAAAS